jgi:hypothetical protein
MEGHWNDQHRVQLSGNLRKWQHSKQKKIEEQNKILQEEMLHAVITVGS